MTKQEKNSPGIEVQASSSVQASKSPACHQACHAIHAHVSRLVSSSGIIDRRSAEIKRARHAPLALSRVFLAQLIENTFCLSSPPLFGLGGGWLLRELASPTWSVFSLSCSPLKRIKTLSPLYSMPGDRFRRPVNLLWLLVFELPSNLPCPQCRCPYRASFFHNNRPWVLVARAWRPKVHKFLETLTLYRFLLLILWS